ncbi:telomeric repeat-binding factor 1 [Fagus crenata]
MKNKLLQLLPVSDVDCRFKKAALLRAIEDQISEASVTETILQLLELIEELDRKEGIEIEECFKSAYCAVAVECTVKYLVANNHVKYMEAVERIWRANSLKLGKTELVTTELTRWGNDLEVALRDTKAANHLLHFNTRNHAMKALWLFLGKACPFLHSDSHTSINYAKDHVTPLMVDPLNAIPDAAVTPSPCHNTAPPTYECDDSQPGSANRLHLPSPKRHKESHLDDTIISIMLTKDKVCEASEEKQSASQQSLIENNSTAATYVNSEVGKFGMRRKMKRWSLLEEDTLRTGVERYGKGNWKIILNEHRDIFEERTEVDLKDKWRNMTRS